SDAVTPFLLLMRKYVRSGRIISVTQPRLERLLTISVSTRVDDGPPRSVELVAELMGRRSNVVLVDEDSRIMDALLRLPPSVNPSRPLLPHRRYTYPAREMKSDPIDPGLGAILRSRAEAMGDGDAWRLIVNTVAGFSPLAAREAIARGMATAGKGQTGKSLTSMDAPWDTIGQAINTLVAPLETGDWQPSAAWMEGKAVDYAPYVLQQFSEAEARAYDSMSEAIVAVAGAERVRRAAPFEPLRRPLLDAIADRTDS